jgi:hypothetical protein
LLLLFLACFQLLKSIKGREDAIDKLKACCNKIGTSDAVLLPTDPMFRLFFR